MVKVGVHSIKSGTLETKIACVLLNVSFFRGVLRLSTFRKWLWRVSEEEQDYIAMQLYPLIPLINLLNHRVILCFVKDFLTLQRPL